MHDLHTEYLREITRFFWENDEHPDTSQMEELARYAHMIVQKNQIINLISRKDTNAVIENHIWISAYISKFIPERCKHFLDIGTGGGFPGIPVAIMRPDMTGVLADSIKKKTDAVKEFADKLMLGRISVANTRVEDPEFIARYRNSFDLVISRATDELITLVRYALPVIKQRAYLIAIKGGDMTEELSKMASKYEPYIRKSTIFELHYKPTNIRNVKEKKLVMLELCK